jgi:hypothetical protein
LVSTVRKALNVKCEQPERFGDRLFGEMRNVRQVLCGAVLDTLYVDRTIY